MYSRKFVHPLLQERTFWPGIHSQLVIWGKIFNISASLLKFIQINSYLKA